MTPSILNPLDPVRDLSNATIEEVGLL